MMKAAIILVVLAACAHGFSVPSSFRIPFERQIVTNVMNHIPQNAQFLRSSNSPDFTVEEIIGNLIDNATLIYADIRPGFSCSGKNYGYYADTFNNCQLFHVCVNMHQLYKELYAKGEYMHFIFICPKYTIFSQDSMVCVYERNAIPCSLAPELYHLNDNFFVVSPKDVPKVEAVEVN